MHHGNGLDGSVNWVHAMHEVHTEGDMILIRLDDFPKISTDKIRYADTDGQGHVNNAVFSTFLETGRVEILYSPEDPVLPEGRTFVIASLKLDFLAEINWPGQVDIGTGLTSIGNSSLRLRQQLHQGESCVAVAETIIVQVDPKTAKSAPLTGPSRERLSRWLLTDPD